MALSMITATATTSVETLFAARRASLPACHADRCRCSPAIRMSDLIALVPNGHPCRRFLLLSG